MEDARIKKLAKLMVKYCINAKPNQEIIIDGSTEVEDFINELYKQIILAKANPLVQMHPKNVDFFYFKHANKKQLTNFPKYWFDTMKKANSYIMVNTDFNTRDLSSCDPKKIALRMKTIEKIESYMLNRWDKINYAEVVFPCLAHAMEADMSLEEWQDFVFSCCLIDWKKFEKKYKKIAHHFHKGEEVHLIGKDVDLKFSIKDKNAILDSGKGNMPGGEIYMAPIKKTMNGWIKFEFPSMYNGKEIRDIFLRFKNGKVIESTASKNEKMLKEALNSDKNASFIGEFGIGVNPKIKKFHNMLNFDEKMSGTIHLALGMAYMENGGGNDSAIHWDLVKDMRKSKIILDGKPVQINGKWKI